MTDRHPVLGVWEVQAEGAPFDHHVMLFQADGIMLQSNPDSGNEQSSDSTGMGVWAPEGDDVVGRFLETRADRTTHRPLGRSEIAFVLRVAGDRFTGEAVARTYDRDGCPLSESPPARLDATRFDARHARANRHDEG